MEKMPLWTPTHHMSMLLFLLQINNYLILWELFLPATFNVCNVSLHETQIPDGKENEIKVKGEKRNQGRPKVGR